LVETTRAPSEQVQDNSSDDNDGEPDEDETASETALARTLLAVSRVIWRAQRASRVEVVGSAAINYVERREAGGQTDEKPFATQARKRRRWSADAGLAFTNEANRPPSRLVMYYRPIAPNN
jgi:hypothetical protein